MFVGKLSNINYGKYVFSQLKKALSQRIFDRFMLKYDGNKKVRPFTGWNQPLCMIFGRVSSVNSLRDLIIVAVHQSKFYI